MMALTTVADGCRYKVLPPKSLPQAVARPDLVTYSILIRANCDAEKLDTALILTDQMIAEGITPDEIIFSSLLGGCIASSNLQVGRKIFNDLVRSVTSSSGPHPIHLFGLYQASLQMWFA
jgi:pentatricopeptide repeat protein